MTRRDRDDDDDAPADGDWEPTAALDASGRLVRPDPPAPELPGYGEELAPPPSDDAPLELAAPDPRERSHRPPAAPPVEEYQPLPGRYAPPPRRRVFGVLVVLLMLAGLGTLAALVLTGSEPVQGIVPRGVVPRDLPLPRGLQAELAPLIIDSEPPGATVFVNGTELGQTPLAMENSYPAGKKARVRLVLRGYRPWTGSFEGGREVTLRATLRRR